jgi:pilus assembly protein CpaB
MALYPDEGLPRPGARRGAEGTSRKARARALVFMVIALAAGLSAAWLINNYLLRRGQTAGLALVKVAVAAVDLPIATSLRPEVVGLVDWPAGAVPQGAFTDVKALEGRVTAMALVRGEPLVESRLTAKGSGQGMAAIIAPTMRAMTVHVNEVIGVAGFIHPGDYVDVISTMQTPIHAHSTTEQEYRSKIVLQNIKVLAVGEDLVTQNAKPVKVPVVTLLVTPEQSERLALSSSHGEVQLTMRSQTDQGEVTTPGVSPPELFAAGAQTALAAAPAPAKQHHSSSSHAPKVAAAPEPPPKKEGEVVEILRGDKFEERKMRAKEGQ